MRGFLFRVSVATAFSLLILGRAGGQTLASALDATNLTWATSGTGGAQG
jgi:hypothetical protein